MNTRNLVTAALVATLVSVSAPAFAQRTATYPEGSIFLAPAAKLPSVAASGATATQRADIGPRNPLDAPEAGNVWKPSNRDAGNLAAGRWQAYADRVKAERGAQQR
jgi:hypothetical protein